MRSVVGGDKSADNIGRMVNDALGSAPNVTPESSVRAARTRGDYA